MKVLDINIANNQRLELHQHRVKSKSPEFSLEIYQKLDLGERNVCVIGLTPSEAKALKAVL